MNQRPFSKLKKPLKNLFVPELEMEMCCTSYRNRGRSTEAIPRFYIKMGKEIIWDCPKDLLLHDRVVLVWSGMALINDVVREYIDTPVDQLKTKQFGDKLNSIFQYVGKRYQDNLDIEFNLTDIFKAADKRLGKRYLLQMAVNIHNTAAYRVLSKRYNIDLNVTIKGTILIADHCDEKILVRLESRTVELNLRTLGGRTLHQGEEVTGIVIQNKFCMCVEYQLRDGTKVYGYISDDSIDSVSVRITSIGTITNRINVNRNDVLNYETIDERR